MLSNELIFSADVETTGTSTANGSLISLGTVAFRPDETVAGRFLANLEEHPGAPRDPDTMHWWEKFPEAWRESTRNAVAPELAMQAYVAWLNQVIAQEDSNLGVVFVANPATFDFGFIFHEIDRCGVPWTRRRRALDIRSYVAAAFGLPYEKAILGEVLRLIPNDLEEHFTESTRSHRADDDAYWQGRGFFAVRRYALAQRQEAQQMPQLWAENDHLRFLLNQYAAA